MYYIVTPITLYLVIRGVKPRVMSAYQAILAKDGWMTVEIVITA
jgi:hypothetical protein